MKRDRADRYVSLFTQNNRRYFSLKSTGSIAKIAKNKALILERAGIFSYMFCKQLTF